MNNLATIYRFNTPFLNLDTEKEHLVSVMKKIEKSLEFDGIEFVKKIESNGKYYKITLTFFDDLGKIEFFYISDDILEYYLPVFKLNIYIDIAYISDNVYRKNTISFLNNIFECFDGLNEREFLIDISNNLHYTTGFFNQKIYPEYDFSDIETIRELFESKNGIILVENFIRKFSEKTFELTVKKSTYYHTLHSIFLYFIYLIFLMNQNIENAKKARLNLINLELSGVYEGQIDLMENRLSYVDEINTEVFEMYKDRLELFFKLFK